MLGHYGVEVFVLCFLVVAVVVAYKQYLRTYSFTADYKALRKDYPYIAQWLSSIEHMVRHDGLNLPYQPHDTPPTDNHRLYLIGRFNLMIHYEHNALRVVVLRDKAVVLDYFHVDAEPTFVLIENRLGLNQFDYDLKELVPPSVEGGLWVNPPHMELVE